MGYAKYALPDGRMGGYGVAAICEQARCNERIDRGHYYLCGDEPGGDEYGCGGYFCDAHRAYAAELYRLGREEQVSLCLPCLDKVIDREWREPLRQMVDAAGLDRDRLSFNRVDDLIFDMGGGEEFGIEATSAGSAAQWLASVRMSAEAIQAAIGSSDPLAPDPRDQAFDDVQTALRYVLNLARA